jgi:hypothetical protein
MPPPRRSYRLRNWLIGSGLAIIVVIGGLVGCSALVGHALNQAANPNSASVGQAQPHAGTSSNDTSSPAPSGPVTLQLGESADISQNGSPAAIIVLSQSAVSTQPADEFSQGPQNGYFVSVHISVNATADEFDVNPLDFYALSGTTHYDEGDGNAFEGPDNANELEATTLNAGETANGWLLFDLPSPHGQIVYAPNLNGEPLAYWDF